MNIKCIKNKITIYKINFNPIKELTRKKLPVKS